MLTSGLDGSVFMSGDYEDESFNPMLQNFTKNVKSIDNLAICHIVITSESMETTYLDFEVNYDEFRNEGGGDQSVRQNWNKVSTNMNIDELVGDTQLSMMNLDEVNDFHRLIRQKSKYFKTLFIRFNAKKNEELSKEVVELINNLTECGGMTTAKNSSIEKQLKTGIANFKTQFMT